MKLTPMVDPLTQDRLGESDYTLEENASCWINVGRNTSFYVYHRNGEVLFQAFTRGLEMDDPFFEHTFEDAFYIV
jgi:hypothetical protein